MSIEQSYSEFFDVSEPKRVITLPVEMEDDLTITIRNTNPNGVPIPVEGRGLGHTLVVDHAKFRAHSTPVLDEHGKHAQGPDGNNLMETTWSREE
jgi:hypothetical protein